MRRWIKRPTFELNWNVSFFLPAFLKWERGEDNNSWVKSKYLDIDMMLQKASRSDQGQDQGQITSKVQNICYLTMQSRAIGCLLVLWNWFKSFIRFCEHVNNPVASHINSHPLSSDNRFLLSVSCFIIWQYTSSRRSSWNQNSYGSLFNKLYV